MTEQETKALRIELHRRRVAHELALGWHRLPHDCPSTIEPRSFGSHYDLGVPYVFVQKQGPVA